MVAGAGLPELLDDKMQAGYVQDAENDTHVAVGTRLDAWADVLRLCDATGLVPSRSSTTAFLYVVCCSTGARIRTVLDNVDGMMAN